MPKWTLEGKARPKHPGAWRYYHPEERKMSRFTGIRCPHVAVMAILFLVAGCSSPQSKLEKTVGEIGAKALVDGAWLTQRNWIHWIKKSGKERRGNIPPNCWANAIKLLNPTRVYSHRVNIVVVLEKSEDGSIEEGLYIYIPISSYLPSDGVDGFSFAPIARDIQKFHRITVGGSGNG